MLKDNRKDTIKNFLSSIPPEIKEKIIEVCGDIKWMYVKLTEQELPQAKMVVDKFHLIRDTNVKIDEAWRIEQETTKKEIKRVSYGFRNVDVYVRKVVLSFIPITLLPLSSHFLL